MKFRVRQWLKRIAANTVARTSFYFLIVIGMTNVHPVVDLFLRPDIPYFSLDHVIVGVVTGVVSGILFGMFFVYTRHLHDALHRIRTLEGILPICSHCKKIRKPNADPREMSSWEPLEVYITERTRSSFSHGLCPECMLKLYPELYEDMQRMTG